MTPAERREPKLLNGSRRARIAAGSGTAVSDVNSLVERFGEAQKMMKSLRGGGMPGMPGMPGVPGMPGMGGGGKKSKGKAQQQRKGGKAGKGGRSGNPAKRALEAQAASQRVAAAQEQALGALSDPADLPPELRDLLGPGTR
jgi:signal recognition particle subunit SRP54